MEQKLRLQAKRKEQFIHYIPLAGRLQPLPGKPGISTCNTNAQTANSPLCTPLLEPLLLSPAVWDIPLVSSSQLSWLCPLPASCPPTAYLLEGQSGKETLMLCNICWAVPKPTGVLCTLFWSQMQNKALHRLLWGELTPTSSFTWKNNIKLCRSPPPPIWQTN